jgi:hypothetical protein
MFSIAAYLSFILAPFVLLGMIWPIWYVIGTFFAFAFIVFFISSSLGLMLTYASNEMTLKLWEMPELWVNIYVNSDAFSFPFGSWKIVYLFLADLVRLWFSLGFSMGGLAWWIPQIIMIYILAITARVAFR